MATTGFWPVKNRLKEVIDYARNPDKTTDKKFLDEDLYAALRYVEDDNKTDRTVYVSGINCPKQRAYQCMMATKQRYGKLGGNVAYHGYQSFVSGEVTPEEAHRIGLETARRMWGKDYEIVVTTHLNTDNLHNHIVVNSVSMKRKLILAGAAFCTALFLFSGFMLCRQYIDDKKSAETFETISALVEEETPEAAPQESETETTAQTAYEKYAAVYEQNNDFVGWISIEGTNIDYPVMQTIDEPNYYLKRGFDKQYSAYGVPYVQENCDLGISDNCVLYGHHMSNGSMFSDLCKYADEDFYREHKIIRFDTLSGFGEYEVIAAFKTTAYSEQGFKYYHFTLADSAEDFDVYISKCKELSIYDTGVSAEYGDKLITLSTCEYSRTNGRMVVVAKQVATPDGEVGDNA